MTQRCFSSASDAGFKSARIVRKPWINAFAAPTRFSQRRVGAIQSPFLLPEIGRGSCRGRVFSVVLNVQDETKTLGAVGSGVWLGSFSSRVSLLWEEGKMSQETAFT